MHITPEQRERLLYFAAQQGFMAATCLWGAFVLKLIMAAIWLIIQTLWWAFLLMFWLIPDTTEPQFAIWLKEGFHLIPYWWGVIGLFVLLGDLPNKLRRASDTYDEIHNKQEKGKK